MDNFQASCPTFVDLGAASPELVEDGYFGARSSSSSSSSSSSEAPPLAKLIAKCASAPLPPCTPGDRAPVDDDDVVVETEAAAAAPSFAAAKNAIESAAMEMAVPPVPPTDLLVVAAAMEMAAAAAAAATMPPVPPTVSFIVASPVARATPKAAAKAKAVPSYMRTTASCRKKRRTNGGSYADEQIRAQKKKTHKAKRAPRAAPADLVAAAAAARGPVTRSRSSKTSSKQRGRGATTRATAPKRGTKKRKRGSRVETSRVAAQRAARVTRAHAKSAKNAAYKVLKTKRGGARGTAHSRKPLTIPAAPKVAKMETESRTTGRQQAPTVTFGESVRRMETEIPHRYHSKPKNANVGTPQVAKRMTLTQPTAVHFGAIHARALPKSTAELESEFMAQQHPFIAKPVDERVMASGATDGSLGVPHVAPAALTEAKTPYFATKARAAMWPSPQASPAPVAFRAHPIPSGMIEGRGISRIASVKSEAMLTMPSSPAFAARDREAAAARVAMRAKQAAVAALAAQKARLEEELRRKTIHLAAQNSTAKTMLPSGPTPYEIWEQTHPVAEEATGPFKARAVGEGVPTAMPRTTPIALPALTKPVGPKLATAERGRVYKQAQQAAVEARDHAEERARDFKAIDATRVKKMLEASRMGMHGIMNAASVASGAQKLTEIQAFSFAAGNARVAQREEFNALNKKRMCVCVCVCRTL